MKITRVRVFEVEGEQRSEKAIYEIARGGLAPNEATPFRGTFTQIETDEGITGLSYGGTAETKTLGELLLGEDPIRVGYLLLFVNTERTCPLGEWVGKINANVQYFFRDWYEPKDSYYEPPAGPGFGYELDGRSIRSRAEV